MKEKLTAYGYLAAWKVVRVVPEPLARIVFDAAAKWASDGGKGMSQLRRNLARVVGPHNVSRDLVVKSMQSYARYWLEAFRLPSMAGDPDVLDAIDANVHGKENLEQSRASGRGTILVLPHTGNWDMAGMYLVNKYSAFTTVAERLKPEIVFDAFVRFRESLGFEVLAHVGEGRPPYDRLKEVLQEGGVVCLLGERDLKSSGQEVTFFGERTSMPTGAVRLAQETGADLMVVHSWFTESVKLRTLWGRYVPFWSVRTRGWGLSVSEPVGITTTQETLQRVAALMESNIAKHPEDWHMLQPLWFSDVDSRRSARGAKSSS